MRAGDRGLGHAAGCARSPKLGQRTGGIGQPQLGHAAQPRDRARSRSSGRSPRAGGGRRRSCGPGWRGRSWSGGWRASRVALITSASSNDSTASWAPMSASRSRIVVARLQVGDGVTAPRRRRAAGAPSAAASLGQRLRPRPARRCAAPGGPAAAAPPPSRRPRTRRAGRRRGSRRGSAAAAAAAAAASAPPTARPPRAAAAGCAPPAIRSSTRLRRWKPVLAEGQDLAVGARAARSSVKARRAAAGSASSATTASSPPARTCRLPAWRIRPERKASRQQAPGRRPLHQLVPDVLTEAHRGSSATAAPACAPACRDRAATRRPGGRRTRARPVGAARRGRPAPARRARPGCG